MALESESKTKKYYPIKVVIHVPKEIYLKEKIQYREIDLIEKILKNKLKNIEDYKRGKVDYLEDCLSLKIKERLGAYILWWR